MAMEGAKFLTWAIGVSLLLAGCRSSPPPEFPIWAAVELDLTESSQHPMIVGAKTLLATDRTFLTQTNYTPDQRKRAMTLWAPGLAQVLGANDAALFEPLPIRTQTGADPHFLGWNSMGRMLVWRVEDALAANNEPAVLTAVRGSLRFSRVLLTGSALHADLGLTQIDNTRKALLPELEKMSPSTLAALADAFRATVKETTDLPGMIDAESKAMNRSVQWLQDSYRAEKWDGMGEAMGREVLPAVDYLRDLRKKDGQPRVEFFKGLAAEVGIEAEIIRGALETPSARRGELPIPEGNRPWKRFAKHMFRTMRPVLAKRDLTLVRTQLLALKCDLLVRVRADGVAPPSLPASAPVDPFTGLPFGYAGAGRGFRLYSLGLDRLDNGGKTDDLFQSPDLTLETGAGS